MESSLAYIDPLVSSPAYLREGIVRRMTIKFDRRFCTQDTKTTFGQRLRMAMGMRGIKTQAQLAQDFGVSRQTVNSWMKRGSSIDADNLFRLADMLQCNARWLYYGPPTSPHKIFVTEEMSKISEIADSLEKDELEHWISQGRLLAKLSRKK